MFTGNCTRAERSVGRTALPGPSLPGLTQRENLSGFYKNVRKWGDGFTPVITSRSWFRDAKETDKKLERWERIVQEAAEQSGRGKVPLLHPVIRLGKYQKRNG